jgi:hypothetical protein
MCRTHECREGQGWTRATRNNLASHFGHGWPYVADAWMRKSDLERSLSNHSYGYVPNKDVPMPQSPGTTCKDALVSRETGCRERLGESGDVQDALMPRSPGMGESGLFRAIVQPALPACPGTRTLHEVCGPGYSPRFRICPRILAARKKSRKVITPTTSQPRLVITAQKSRSVRNT